MEKKPLNQSKLNNIFGKFIQNKTNLDFVYDKEKSEVSIKGITYPLSLKENIFLDKRTSQLTIGRQTTPIRRFVVTQYDKSMKLHKDVKLVNFTSDISVIYMSNYNTFLTLDEKTYNSLYIQLMVFENYDKNLFEPVILSPNAKVYKLKI